MSDPPGTQRLMARAGTTGRTGGLNIGTARGQEAFLAGDEGCGAAPHSLPRHAAQLRQPVGDGWSADDRGAAVPGARGPGHDDAVRASEPGREAGLHQVPRRRPCGRALQGGCGPSFVPKWAQRPWRAAQVVEITREMMVGAEGFEPSCPLGLRLLRAVRLPSSATLASWTPPW